MTIGEVLEPQRLRRVGHEAGSLSPWLHPGLVALGLPAVCLETRHVRAAMGAQRNKTDAADALGTSYRWPTERASPREACASASPLSISSALAALASMPSSDTSSL